MTLLDLPDLITAVELLRTIDAKLDVLLSKDLSTRGQVPSALSRTDLERLGHMLPAIAGVHGSKTMSSRDLAEDDAPAVRLVVRGLSVKAISKLFARAVGIPIDGLMVRKAGVEFQVMTWQIVAC